MGNRGGFPDATPGARALLVDLSDAHADGTPRYAANLGTVIRAALSADPGLAAELAEGLPATLPLGQHAGVTAHPLLAEHQGRCGEAAALFAHAVQRWGRFEMPWEQAQALLGQGRCLLALGRAAEAREPLRTARDILTSLGARPTLTDVDRLLAQATAATA